MPDKQELILAVKCAPEKRILINIEKASISAVELYTNNKWLRSISKIKQTCKEFPFRYAVHAPTDGYEPELLAELVNEVQAEIVVFHDIYWDAEWVNIAKIFSDIKTKICIENVASALDPVKLMRRYGFGRCLDLEHLQMQCGGVFEDDFLPVMCNSSHIHLTGYYCGSDLWHTPIHYAPEHSSYMLKLLKKSNYSGMVVSEAKVSYQTIEEFTGVAEFARKLQI